MKSISTIFFALLLTFSLKPMAEFTQKGFAADNPCLPKLQAHCRPAKQDFALQHKFLAQANLQRLTLTHLNDQ